ncbi:uncharacterized protein B0T23DRAFT_455458 [Neurospora hispaniola]|uniref:Uncharacterized protein n=1 Tax=Neurospora hispaniola TaxID=588809 RepID=A0AAJ0I480_9PEZI|nr:hypothetical protein B0T23DRAFT_455458 [Neurospora hispaniola]
MSISRDQSIRTDLEKLYRQISTRFSLLNFFFDDPLGSTDMENPKWKDEGEECKRLSDRFETWARTYKLGAAGQLYDMKRRMDKKRELLTLCNRLYDATEHFPNLTEMSWKDDPDRPSENCSDSSSDDGKQRRPSRAIPDEERTEGDLKKQYAGQLLKVSHQLYECERFQFELKDFEPERYTAHMNDQGQIDQEEKDTDRAVYKKLYEGEDDGTIINNLFDTMRRTHVAAHPMIDWESRLTELVPYMEPTRPDGPSQDP